MAYLYLDNGSTTYSLDDNAISVSIGSTERNYKMVSQFRDGGYLTGAGNLQGKSIIFTKSFRKSGTEVNAFNTLRDLLMSWFMTPKTTAVYLTMVKATGVTQKIQVYPVSLGEENYNSLAISNSLDIELQSPDGFFTKTTVTTDTQAVPGTGLFNFTITYNGQVQCPPLFTFTPTGNYSSITLTNNGYTFVLTYSFLTGVVITIDCATGIVTVGGVVTNNLYTSGTPWNLQPGANNIGITAQAGTLVTTYYERYL